MSSKFRNGSELARARPRSVRRNARDSVGGVARSTPKYTILGPVHRGGMGEILLAKVEAPDGFSRKVVLKGLLSRLADDPTSRHLFLREARLTAALDHPNIVRVFDLATIDGRLRLVMEYVRGRNFHQTIQRAAAGASLLPTAAVFHVLAHVLRGLHHAHCARDADGRSLGIVHRDVSPGNVLVSFFGEVKVTDFGIAMAVDAPKFTAPRAIRGKARYVAPEQIQGEPATAQSDIYSAGVVFAEALMGATLWERPSVADTLSAIVCEDREATIARILEKRGTLPGVDAALRGSLAISPRDRFPSALEFAETLEWIAKRSGASWTSVDVGLLMRELFADAPDLPRDDGFGRSGYRVPTFDDIDISEGTEPTLVELAPRGEASSPEPTVNMRAPQGFGAAAPRGRVSFAREIREIVVATEIERASALVREPAELTFSEILPALPRDTAVDAADDACEAEGVDELRTGRPTRPGRPSAARARCAKSSAAACAGGRMLLRSIPTVVAPCAMKGRARLLLAGGAVGAALVVAGYLLGSVFGP